MTSDSFRLMLTCSLSLYIHDVQVSLCIKVMILNFSFSNIVIYVSGFSVQHIGRDYVSKILVKLKQEGPEALNRSPEYTGQRSNII